MRIGLIIYNSLDTVSGGYLYDRKLVEYLQSQGDQVQIFSLPWRSYARHLGDNFSSSMHNRLRQAKLDILLQDELNHPSLCWLNARLRKTLKIPVLSIVHHLRSSELRPVWQNAIYHKIESRYLKSVDGFIFNSQTTREVVGKTGTNLHSQRYIVAYPAGNRFNPRIHDQQIAQRARQPGPLQVIFLGNVIPRKGLHTLLAALNQLPRKDWALSVIGSMDFDTTYAEFILRQLADARLEANVQLLGSLPDIQLAEQLQNSHLLVVPSSYEGFGIVYLEGMSFGLPAIASNYGAAGEIITHERNGFLITPGDTAALAGHLDELIHNRDHLLELSLEAHQRYLDHPTWEQTTQKIRNFLLQWR